MRPTDGGGGGGTRILIDPVSLRTGSSRLTDTMSDLSQVSGAVASPTLPEMPPGLAPLVAGRLSDFGLELTQQHQELASSAEELVRRAFWTEIADQLATHAPLSAAQLRDFKKWLADGSLMRYATREQKQLAGMWAGDYFKSRYENPNDLVDLAHILGGSGRNADFSVAFVEHFGGDNLAKIPRVIQALEGTDRLSALAGLEGHVETGLGAQYAAKGEGLNGEDPIALLANFTMALAVATQAVQRRGSHELDEAQAELNASDDHWAVAALASSKETYGTKFLVDTFQHHLIPLVQQDTNDYVQGALPASYVGLGWDTDHPLMHDPKMIILDALARNGQAAADALSTPLDDKVFFQTAHGPVESDNPVEILWRGRWEDGGDAFANVYTSATDHMMDVSHYDDRTGDWHSLSPQERAALQEGNTITYNAIDQLLHSPQELDPVRDALVNDLAHHHMSDLFTSAGRMQDLEGIGTPPDGTDPSLQNLDAVAERDLLAKIAEDDDADKLLHGGVVAHEAQLIADNTHGVPNDKNLTWAHQLGAFTALDMSAHDVEMQDEFDATDDQHKLLFAVGHGAGDLVLGLTPAGEVPLAGFTVDQGLNILESALEGDPEQLAQDQATARGLALDNLHAAITAGYYENHAIQAPSQLIDADTNQLANYADLREHDENHRYDHLLSAYHDWMYQDVVRDGIGEGAHNPGAHLEPVRLRITEVLERMEKKLPDG